MTRRRWIADEVSGDRAALIGAHAEHLSRALRAQPGQTFDVVANGVARTGTIVAVDNHRVEFELGQEIAFASAPDVTLLMSIFKFDRMEWAIEKCTELGVSSIVPVIAGRSERHLVSAAAKRWQRWQRLARQASEQSRRTQPPDISQPTKFQNAVLIPADVRVVLDESEMVVTLRESAPSEGSVALAFGPEGGWTGDELQNFHSAGWKSASLGNTILRAETAAIAATAIAISMLEAQH